ncbi:serine kinase [Erythrobacter sp. QSSC1-22B]|nr:serine kinase [Erythrobacter sp. QSSC1-22B]
MAVANLTCIAINGRGLLIEGPPGSGKSTLALEMIDRGAVLVGDDGVTLDRRGERLWAAPPPHTAGKLEIRGVGIVDMPCDEAPVALVLSLTEIVPRLPECGTVEWLGCSIPRLAFVASYPASAIRAEHALARFGLV